MPHKFHMNTASKYSSSVHAIVFAIKGLNGKLLQEMQAVDYISVFHLLILACVNS
jgi:hypothetical protein